MSNEEKSFTKASISWYKPTYGKPNQNPYK